MNKLNKNLLLFSSLLLVSNLAFSAATFVIQIADAPGEGFNDPTPVAPVGGNPGTTLGAQRLEIFQKAGEIWGQTINSVVPIVINAQFDPLTPCAPGGSVLGSAGALTIHSDFTNAPVANTWYGQALANSIAGTDQDAATADINARFNSDIDNGCSGSVGWYYGFDGATPSDRIALLPVLLHELGHGLGFQTFTSNQTGAFFSGRPDIWTNFLFDLDQNLSWRDLPSNAARQASAINDPNLVWTGPNVTAEFPNVLDNPNQLTVNTPASIAGNNPAQGAQYGPAVPNTGVTANVVLVNDNTGTTTDGCEPISTNLVNSIALIDRGTCNFTVKSINAQNAGAIGVLITNNAATGLPPMGGTDPLVTVPSIGISMALGDSIKTELLSGNVNVTMNYDLTAFAGANSGSVRLNAPDPVVPGSSVSHWTPDTSPNLLMEPAITATIFDQVDLTRELFIDIGWSVVPPVDLGIIFKDSFEN